MAHPRSRVSSVQIAGHNAGGLEGDTCASRAGLAFDLQFFVGVSVLSLQKASVVAWERAFFEQKVSFFGLFFELIPEIRGFFRPFFVVFFVFFGVCGVYLHVSKPQKLANFRLLQWSEH